MLIAHWNEASRTLPVLTLKSNYLDRWPTDWHRATALCSADASRSMLMDQKVHYRKTTYCIAGKFDGELKLAVWRSELKSPN